MSGRQSGRHRNILTRWKMVHGMSYWNVPFSPVSFDFGRHYKEAYPGVKECAYECYRHFPGGCGDAIYYHIFMFSPVSTGCCIEMINNGDRCNDCINDALSTIKRFRRYANRMREFTARLLKECRHRTGN